MDAIGVKGRLRIVVRDDFSGAILRDEWTENKVVNSGLSLIRDLILNGDISPTHIAVGTDSTAPAAVDSALGVEVFRGAVTQRAAPSAFVARIQLFIAADQANGNTLREAGIFNRDSGGAMLSRVTFSGIIKSAAVTVTLTWELTVSEA